MHAAVVRTIGQPPVYGEFPDPTPQEGEVLINVRAAALTNLGKLVTYDPDYSAGAEVPFVAGVEGVGTLQDGTRVGFAAQRPPYGSMGELTVSFAPLAFPVPDGVSDATAAALINPGFSSWLPFASQLKLEAGAKVLILGATGVAGKLAVQIAKHLGAGRVVAAGRNRAALEQLPSLGADRVVSLDQPEEKIAAEFAQEAGEHGFDVVLDYIWGRPAEIFLGSLPRSLEAEGEVRYVQLGNSAGPTATIEGNALRRAGITIIGTGSMPSLDIVKDVWERMTDAVVKGSLTIDVDEVPLSEVHDAWNRETPGRRLVFVV
ncbi:hypothetical protein BLA24_02605 [Streptomyces cinnamoneus]|uniref:Enoyl reductase (ER) domain-containing protein n=1 Tax=Streptomyces cinnamoneus TaxID=53446 RepID=A0A2G1XPR0_STRCJ|nr:zinc-binding alcohol dehydrogenase family protein [Streptomyces cinnamoneus]PHQ53224.1 hypothetical protein BLA24_02605 [Streptomyces cinnamoneus]PPT12316.1 zinc-binding alcohol dehydrogenase [Streptomyces cinnamoneus]